MRRREFITLLGGATAAWPFAAHAEQSAATRRIGVLMNRPANDSDQQANDAAFRKRLQELGWAVGRNLQIDYRWEIGVDHLKSGAAELVHLAPDAILAANPPTLSALQQATNAIPIVFALVADPVLSGYVSSLSHPGGNITGFTNFEYTIAGKWLELLKDVAPGVTNIAIVVDPDNVTGVGYVRVLEAAAQPQGLQLISAPVRNSTDIEQAIDGVARRANSGMIVLPNAVTALNREMIVALAERHNLPAVYPYRYFSGGLLSYGVDAADVFAQAASYIDRILKGEKPGDLPVQAPNKFDLVINLKTAKTLGLTVPPTLLAIADEVIE
jgi:putative ABC transport system substrate-binding protein